LSDAKFRIADIIKFMPYGDLIDIATDLVAMQKDAQDHGWEWKPNEVHGEFGLANMLNSWADAQEEEETEAGN